MSFPHQINLVRNLSISYSKWILRETKGDFVTILDHHFPKAYKPALVEKDVYDFWESNGYFTSNKGSSSKYSMVLPPPNVTGTLHLGHALTAAIEDTIARFNRMEGKDVLWIPGLDHAGIATQTVVERWLKKKKNLSRQDIGKDQFLNEVINWKNEKGSAILQQLRKFGASLDWSKEMFTMDQRHNEAVVEALVRLWNSGLIYRKKSLINWCCQLSSAISDIEVDRLEIVGPTHLVIPGYEDKVLFGEIVDFSYKVHGSDDEIVVSTTRPETMLGDVAVAVHPNDCRFSHLHNAKLWHPFRHTTIPIICDSMVNMNFGKGAVKITPGHSQTDWDVAQRHGLPIVSVIDESGRINVKIVNNMFQGMKRFKAREVIKNKLAEMSLLRSVRPHTMHIPVCSRTGDVIEYLPKDQWFISCKAMAEKALSNVREGRLCIEPSNFEMVWYNWLENVRDWCISRQLWWGHQLPMYCATRGDTLLWLAATSHSQAIRKATSLLGSEPDTMTRDPDVVDTWFSSALYPLSSLGWPNQTDDLKQYYPLNVMETGHDILFFWVARMVMLGTELTGQLPFKKILLHGIICDSEGRKMSKSLGNVINPEDVIKGINLENLKKQVTDNHKAGILSLMEMELAHREHEKKFPNGIPECGTDALRFTLISNNTKSNFLSFDVKECETNHHFCNKIWQATRFTLFWADYFKMTDCCIPARPGLMDRWILSQLSQDINTVRKAMTTGDLCMAAATLKEFLYYKFCNVYVESAKPILRGGTDAEATNTCQTMLSCLDHSLRLLSPIMPFLTEQLYKHLPGNIDKSAMLQKFPTRDQNIEDLVLDNTVKLGLNISSSIRTLKGILGFYQKQIPVVVETMKINEVQIMKEVIEYLAKSKVTIIYKATEINKSTLTNTLGDHTLIHIDLQNVSEEQFSDYITILLKKEAKLLKSIDNIMEKTKKKNYQVKVDDLTKTKHADQIQTLARELHLVRLYLDKTKVEL